MQLRRGLEAALMLALAIVQCASSQAVAAQLQSKSRVLRLDDRGPDVVELQKRLDQLGYHLAVDGVFGRATLNAVLTLQRTAGLTPDGVVGASTYQVLAQQAGSVYTVQVGDTLGRIAAQHHTTVATLARLNGITNRNHLLVGEPLVIGASRVAHDRLHASGTPTQALGSLPSLGQLDIDTGGEE